MSSAAIMQGTYADLKIIRGRKVVQQVIEYPIEQAEQLVTTFGMPNPASETWVAVARLNLKAAAEKDDGVQAPKNVRRSWGELSYAEQAALLCNNPVFRRFLFENDMMREKDLNADNEAASKAAATAVRLICSVNSRADIKPSTPAEQAFRRLCADYELWKNI